GVANLEAATGRPFAELFRDWSVSLMAGDPELHRRLGSRLLCGPRLEPVPLTQGSHQLDLAGTAAGYCLLHSPGAAHTQLTVTADPAADLQVTLVRLPRQTPRLSLICERLPEAGRVRLTLEVHGGPVRLTDAAWERLSPSGAASGDTDVQPASMWFGK